MQLSKKCYECKVTKSIKDFAKNSSKKDGYQGNCKQCFNKYHSKYIKTEHGKKLNRLKNKKHYYNNLSKSKFKRLKYKFWPNLTWEETKKEYDKLLNLQENECAICKKKETAKHSNGNIKMLAVDHCHITNKIRGLLCDSCNVGLGKFRDDPELLNRAKRYLLK